MQTDLAIIELDYILAHQKTQSFITQAVLATTLRLFELEHLGLHLTLIKTIATIVYLHLQTLGIVSITCNHLYLATNGELARILKQVYQHLLQPHLIAK